MPSRARALKRSASAVATRTSARSRVIAHAIITMSADGTIQAASDKIERIFGWSPAELFGRNVSVLIAETAHGALNLCLDRCRHSAAKVARRPIDRLEGVHRNGRSIGVELLMSCASSSVNTVPFLIGIVRPVQPSEDAVADCQWRQMREFVAEQTRALETANLNLRLADGSVSLGTLAAGLGHDLNNVLLPIRARLNALEHSGISAAAFGHLTAVRRCTAYLEHLSDGLHFLAIDPEAPHAPANGAGVTDLALWWRQVGALLRKAVPEHVRLRASFSERLPAVNIDAQWLTQAVLNLIVNAGEAMPKARREPAVRLRATSAKSGRTVRLAVTDNGSGMTPEVLHRAFDLYFTTKPRGMGTGLGLPLARTVALRAGGDIELRSFPGRGTTVVLVLPSAPRVAAGDGPPGISERRAKVSVRDRRTAALISQVLIGAGVRISPDQGPVPDESDLWITDPTPRALIIAQRWRKGDGHRVVVLAGAPSSRMRKSWAAVSGAVIDPPNDFKTIRDVLGRAIATGAKQLNEVST